MSRPSNHRRSWEPSDWDHLANLVEQQVSTEYIARKLGRTPGATAAAIFRMRHGLHEKPNKAPGARFTSYAGADYQPSILNARERRKTRRRARALFTLVLFGLRLTICKAAKRGARQ